MNALVLENEKENLSKGWIYCILEDIVNEVNSGFPSGKHNKEQKGIPHIRPMNIDYNGNIDLSVVKYVENNTYDHLRKGDVLFNNTNSPKLLGKTALIKQDTNWAYSNHMTRIRFDISLIEPKWMAYFLHKLFWEGYYKIRATNHVNQSSINSTYLSKQIPILLAPLNEQKRIVAKIEELFSRIDSTKQLLENIKILLNQYRQSLLKFTFTGELTKKWKNINNIKQKWENTPLENLTVFSKNGFTGRPNSEGNGTARLGIETITGSNSIYVDESRCKFIKITPSKLELYKAKKGDLFVCRQNGNKNYVGKCAIYKRSNTSTIFSDSLIQLRINQELILSEYLAYFLNSKYGRSQIEQYCSTTAGNFSVNGTNLKKTVVTYPSIPEQEIIISKIEDGFSLIDSTEKILSLSLRNVNGLKKSILKQAFEGKLIPQDTNDEPAEVLLQKIKQEKQKIISHTAKPRKKKNDK